jgi:hypothetical protein
MSNHYIPPWSREQKSHYPKPVVLDVRGYMARNHLTTCSLSALMSWLTLQHLTEITFTFPDTSGFPVVHAVAPRPLPSHILTLFFQKYNHV